MTKQQQLDELKRVILEASVCLELRNQATQLVMGDGNVDADIMFIGEAPGKNEDEQGIPFVGSAGKFLDVLLESIGLERRNIYITNIVKYRPPNNRDPLPEEKQAFLPYLLEQIHIIQPVLIITLGRHSMEYFLPGAHISIAHGREKIIQIGTDRVTLYPLYHPAAALYNGGLRATLLEDFSRIPKIISRLK